MPQIAVPSGAEVVINPAEWVLAKELKKAIEKEMAIAGAMSLSAVLFVDSSNQVEAALMPCLARCLYNKEKITDRTFDDPKARQDYYDIIDACVKENLGPLAVSLRSKLLEYGLLKPQAKEGQKSESTTKPISPPAA